MTGPQSPTDRKDVSDSRAVEIAPWLLKAKVSPPKYKSLAFFRPMLLAQLDEIYQKPVTLVEAPAGFGKSTLLAYWAAQAREKGYKTAWVSTEEADDPENYIAYMAFAFHVAGLDMSAHGLLSPQFKGDNQVNYELNAFIGGIERSETPSILILDDFERAPAEIVDRVVARLLDNLPDNLHLIIACRQNPGLSLSRQEIGGDLKRINAETLRMGPDEVQKFFGDTLGDDEAQSITDRTAGWPVVIQLLKSISTDSPSERQKQLDRFTGASDQAAAYFSEQLFDRLGQEERAFLEDISILERVSPEAGNYLRQREDTHALMASLSALDSLFPEVEAGAQERRLHPLLREYLQKSLATTNLSRFNDLHIRAASWYFDRSEINRAIDHARRAGDEQLAGDFVERVKGLQIWINEGMDRLEGLMAKLSPDILDTYPRLILARAIIEMKKGHIRAARHFQEKASIVSRGFTQDRSGGSGKMLLTDRYLTETLLLGYSCLPFHQHLSHTSVKVVLENAGEDHTIRGYIITIDCLSMQQIGQFELSKQASIQAIKEYQLAQSFYGELFIYIHTGMVALAEGNLAEVKKKYAKATSMARDNFPADVGLACILDAIWAEYHLEIGDLAAARRHLQRVPATLENREAWFDIYMASYRTVVATKVASGDTDGLDRFFQAVLDHTRREDLELLEQYVQALRVSAYLDLGQLDRALDIYRDWGADHTIKSLVWREQETLAVAHARILVKQGRNQVSRDVLDTFITAAQKQGNVRNYVVGLCWRLRLFAASEPIEDVIRDLTAVTERVPCPSQYQIATILGRRADSLCAALSAAGDRSDVQPLLTYLQEIEGNYASAGDSPVQFSPREQEVLAQLVTGLSDKEIARVLDVTPHAVRYHLKNIYAKTGARNRMEAAGHYTRHRHQDD
ncbi:LuxR C-terminal-related transcriptional regulator [Kordiimonas sediminis]|nr:LuxR C-terminal-related transcriptional regulator [Kordiimonas sediminis]